MPLGAFQHLSEGRSPLYQVLSRIHAYILTTGSPSHRKIIVRALDFQALGMAACRDTVGCFGDIWLLV